MSDEIEFNIKLTREIAIAHLLAWQSENENNDDEWGTFDSVAAQSIVVQISEQMPCEPFKKGDIVHHITDAYDYTAEMRILVVDGSEAGIIDLDGDRGWYSLDDLAHGVRDS